ncbi:MAG: choice-of-anchor tandem repeat GloVer-containing protein [Rhizomicrobium sp.]
MFEIVEKFGKAIFGGVFAVALLMHCAAHAASFKVLHSFSGGRDGCYPGSGNLVLDGVGNIYGTTVGNPCNYGTVFEIPAKGTETTLYNFRSGTNGELPDSLAMDSNGNLYGTTIAGGNAGCGVIFEITTNGREKTAHEFAGGPNDACVAEGAPLVDGNGNLYGTSSGGGKASEGAVYKFVKDSRITLLYSFRLGPKGHNSISGVIMDGAGNLYGTTVGGGPKKSMGTVFELTPSGSEAVLYGFKGSPDDGAASTGGLLMDKSGDLFGTTYEGGRPGCAGDAGCGVVFELAPGGTETVLHFFTGNHGDGANPFQGVIADSSGNLYGTTEYGGRARCQGACGGGTVFKLAPDRTETILHSFRTKDGINPRAGLIADAAGNLYGTTQFGGAYGYGTVFEITP